MNRWEREYAARLNLMKASREIAWFGFEALSLCIAQGKRKAWFTPDFVVVRPDGRMEFHEVKGMWREAARVRIKVAAGMYPHWRFVAVQKRDGSWIPEEF